MYTISLLQGILRQLINIALDHTGIFILEEEAINQGKGTSSNFISQVDIQHLITLMRYLKSDRLHTCIVTETEIPWERHPGGNTLKIGVRTTFDIDVSVMGRAMEYIWHLWQ